MTHFARMLIATWCFTMALAGCDQIAQTELKVGESTADDVRRLMGKPDMIWAENDGREFLDYPRAPAGHVTYRVEIGPDGRYRGMRNLLVDERFRQVNAGMTRDDIYQLLGKPSERTPFPLKNEEVWSWRHKGDGQTAALFNIHLDMDGRVKTTSQSMDARNLGG